MSNETPELLPCPFCGNVDVAAGPGHDSRSWTVACRAKSAECPMEITVIECFSEEQAIAAWNRRAARSSGEAAPADVQSADDLLAAFEVAAKESQRRFTARRWDEAAFFKVDATPATLRNDIRARLRASTAGGEEPERDQIRREWCMDCDGCGWCEGSPAYTCATCNGTGHKPIADVGVEGTAFDDALRDAGLVEDSDGRIVEARASLSSSGSPASPLSDEDEKFVAGVQAGIDAGAYTARGVIIGLLAIIARSRSSGDAAMTTLPEVAWTERDEESRSRVSDNG